MKTNISHRGICETDRAVRRFAWLAPFLWAETHAGLPNPTCGHTGYNKPLYFMPHMLKMMWLCDKPDYFNILHHFQVRRQTCKFLRFLDVCVCAAVWTWGFLTHLKDVMTDDRSRSLCCLVQDVTDRNLRLKMSPLPCHLLSYLDLSSGHLAHWHAHWKKNRKRRVYVYLHSPDPLSKINN